MAHTASTSRFATGTPDAAGSYAARRLSVSALIGKALTMRSSQTGSTSALEKVPDTSASGRYVPLVIAPDGSGRRMAVLTARPSAAKHVMPRASAPTTSTRPPGRGATPNATRPSTIVVTPTSSDVASTLTSCAARYTAGDNGVARSRLSTPSDR